jgi:hypothetical protein
MKGNDSMAGRPKKIEQKIEQVVEEKEVKQNTSNFEEFITPENMMKMFAMFKQMESMQQDASKEADKDKKINKKLDNKFSKADLAKIGDEVVIVKSAVDNVTFTSPKTKIEYNWSVKGDVEPLPVSEILAMEGTSKRFLHTPWLVIEDDRVIQALGLKRIYDLIKKVEDIEELVKLSKDDIKSIFEELPPQYKNNFKNEIYRKVKSRELNNLTTIDDLSDILKINLKDI